MQILKNTLSGFIRIQILNFIIFPFLLLVNIPVSFASPPDAEICAFLEKFHGHICPGSLMGLRLGLAAKEALNAKGRIESKTFMLACSVDGIQVGVGTTFGNKALTVEDRNEMSLILTDIKTGKQIEARLTDEAMGRGKDYKELMAKSRSFKQGSSEQLAVKKEIDDILDWYRKMPDEKVVIIKVLK